MLINVLLYGNHQCIYKTNKKVLYNYIFVYSCLDPFFTVAMEVTNMTV